MPPEITGLHHVGHVVRDLPAALAAYRRLGFTVPAPAYPAMPPREGAEPEPFGAVNTHADFPGNFLELATVVEAGGSGERLPDGARLVPLDAPPEVLPTLVDRIRATSANLAACLDRFEGLHILMFSSADIDATSARLARTSVPHGGVNSVRRPVDDQVETVRYLELDPVAEGRVGVVAELDPRLRNARLTEHPNGATGLVDATLCVADAELDEVQQRYERYLGRPGPVFDFGGATLTLVPGSRLGSLFPGERPPALPALVACTIAVRDLTATANLLRGNGVRLRQAPSGGVFVPAPATLGTVVVFR